jgi:hypothetical protein
MLAWDLMSWGSDISDIFGCPHSSVIRRAAMAVPVTKMRFPRELDVCLCVWSVSLTRKETFVVALLKRHATFCEAGFGGLGQG